MSTMGSISIMVMTNSEIMTVQKARLYQKLWPVEVIILLRAVGSGQCFYGFEMTNLEDIMLIILKQDVLNITIEINRILGRVRVYFNLVMKTINLRLAIKTNLR